MCISPQSPDGFSGACAQAGAMPNSPTSEVCLPCQANAQVQANYDDPWNTPITLRPLQISYVDGEMIDAGGELMSAKSLGTEDGFITPEVRPVLGTYETPAPRHGMVNVSIVPEGGPDPAALERAIVSDLQAYSTEMQTAVQPWITEWEDEGFRSLLSRAWEGLKSGAQAWWDGEGDFWNAVGDWITNIPDMLVNAWDSATQGLKQLWENRSKILQLIRDLADGLVEDFERGLEALANIVKNIPGLGEISELLNDLVQKSAEWAGAMIELATRTNVLRAIGGAILGTIMMIPPNFYAEMVSKGVGYLLPEAIIAILFAILAFFTGGGAAPALYARIAAFVLRTTNALKKAGKAGQALLKVFNLLRNITDKVVDLVRALKARIAETTKAATDRLAVLTRRIRRHDVPCFDLPNGANAAEFTRQLAEQQATINKMTADDMAYAHHMLDLARAEKERLQDLGQWKGGSFTDLLRNNSAQTNARNLYRDQLRQQGYSRAQIREMMGRVHATHYLDIIAGGAPDRVGIGGAAENSGIGRSWPRDGRAEGIGEEARWMRRNGLSGQKMNVRLRVC